MVQLLVRVTAAPGRVEDTVRALSSIRMPARLDRGCLSTYAGVDAGEPDICLYLEEWADRDLLTKRLRSASFRALLMLMETSIASPFLEIRDVSGLGGLDYVARACGEQEEDAGAGGARAALARLQHTK
jgi:quinol monooxygenase YgiN